MVSILTDGRLTHEAGHLGWNGINLKYGFHLGHLFTNTGDPINIEVRHGKRELFSITTLGDSRKKEK